MARQYNIFGEIEEPQSTKPKIDKAKRNWEDRFQRWSDNISQDGTTPYGICACGSMCDYCEDNTYGRPCVRALNEMCKEKNIKIDYEHQSYEDAWNGVFN